MAYVFCFPRLPSATLPAHSAQAISVAGNPVDVWCHCSLCTWVTCKSVADNKTNDVAKQETTSTVGSSVDIFQNMHTETHTLAKTTASCERHFIFQLWKKVYFGWKRWALHSGEYTTKKFWLCAHNMWSKLFTFCFLLLSLLLLFYYSFVCLFLFSDYLVNH